MKNKKKVNNNKLRYKIFFLGLIFILIISLIGISFSYWRFESKQNDQNIASSKCFKVIITNESDAITLSNMHPISDEEGLKSSSYSFTIENTCDTYAMYQVNLEDILDDTITKRLNNKYIKISLNDGTPKVLNTYQSVTPTINNADASFKLTSGSLSPKGSSNDSVNYNLKLWMNYDTPALDEVMSATFKSKISVVSVYTEEDKLTNDITITYNTKATDYTKDSETIDINATSTNYNLIEYSTDNITYTSIDTPSKNVIITKTYAEDKDETIYFRDEIGNLKSKKVVLSKLDQTGPVITVSASSDWGSSNTISITLEDNKSGLAVYALTETETEPSEWTSITGKSTTITKEVTSNKTYYVYAKDALGNISHKEVVVSHIDTASPIIVSLTEQSSYGATSTITAVAKDTESGITGYAFTESSSEPTSWTSVDNVITESTYTYKATKNGTIYFWVKDGSGHKTNKAITVTKVDATAPTVTLSLSNETTWTKAKTLTMNFNDNESGLVGYAVTTTETTPTTWTSISGTSISKTKNITTNGTYYVWVKDKAGLVSHGNKTISYIDTTAPTASMTLTKTSDSITADASSSSDTESGIAKYEYSIDNTTYYSSISSTYTFTGLSVGTYTIYLRVTDNAGNVENTTNQVAITILLTTKITQLATTDTTNLATDDYGNARYIGKNPNNYVWFDEQVYQYDTYSLMYNGEYYGAAENTTLEECQNAILNEGLDGDADAECKKEHSKGDKILWRIIGVMKDIDDGTGNKSDRVKLIRADSIGSYSWDTGESSVNKGQGVNEWSQADLMKLLNPGYESETVGGSLYWNNKQGTCYSYDDNSTTSCNFTSTGIKNKLKALISDAVWNTGASTTSNQIASKFYTEERGTRNGKICSSGNYCNDTIERTTTWTGKVGLMYPSDYGYATSGGSTTDRATCLNTNLSSWNSSIVSDCKNNDWLFNSSYQWTISPLADSSLADFAFFVSSGGYVYNYSASNDRGVRPVVYLTSNTSIQSGDGSSSNPFILG